ncbi:Flavodoxin [uncultured Paludibacter sp.]|nr:Flavodoxin [uncultured Paludibacter sp.]
MKTAIIYTTTHGTSEKVAKYIAEKFPEDDVTLIKLKKNTKFSIFSFDKIILGGSIYLGDIQPIMRRFCNDNFEELLTRTLGLYVCGIEPELVRQDSELEMAFPKKLFKHAVATAFVGGEITFEKLNPTQKFIVKNFLKIKESVDFIHYDLIDIFVYQMLSA